MNLSKKKELAARTLKVGKERIVFVKSRLEEIKEAITKQDIRDLNKEGAIIIKEKKGRKKVKKRKTRRSRGNIRKKVKKRKQNYVVLTRKLRNYVAELKNRGELSKEEIKEIRKKIRNKDFRSKSNLKEYLEGLKTSGGKSK
jgi:large subunit ribosomal protein L19e